MNAGETFLNLKMVSTTPPSAQFVNPSEPGDFQFINSDLAFTGSYVVQGNFNGIQIWDISQPSHPTLVDGLRLSRRRRATCRSTGTCCSCRSRRTSGRLDCGAQGVHDTVSTERMRGIRIFDISDIAHPEVVANVQTCRGSHTHTVVTDPKDTDERLRLRLGLGAGAARRTSWPDARRCAPDQDPNSELFRIEVIQVPLAHPEQARVVSKPAILDGLASPPSHGEAPEDIAAAARIADSARATGGVRRQGVRHRAGGAAAVHRPDARQRS